MESPRVSVSSTTPLVHTSQPDDAPASELPQQRNGGARERVLGALSGLASRFSSNNAAPEGGLTVPDRASADDSGRVRMRVTKAFADGSTRTDLFRAPLAPSLHPTVKTNSYGIPERVDASGNPLVSDSHFHPTNYVQQGMTPKAMLKMMDEAGVFRSVMMPIPTDAAPCGNPDHNHIPPESYYIPARHANITRPALLGNKERGEVGAKAELERNAHLILNQQVDADTAMYLELAKLTDAERDRLDPMVTGLHLGSPLSSQALLYKLGAHKGVFTGVGEVTIHKELVEKQYEGTRQANLTDNVQSFKNLMATAGVIGMPAVMHCDVDSLENQYENGIRSPVHLEDIKRLLKSPELKDTTMIWAHFGGIGRFVAKPAGHEDSLDTLLSDPDMKHVNIDISWSRVAEQIMFKQDKNGNFALDEHGKQIPDDEKIEAFANLIKKHPTRFLFGSDALDPKETATWTKTNELYQPLWDKLDDATRTAVKTGNYDRLIVDARKKVRAFEKHVLTDDFMSGLRRADGSVHEGPHISPHKLRTARDEAFALAELTSAATAA